MTVSCVDYYPIERTVMHADSPSPAILELATRDSQDDRNTSLRALLAEADRLTYNTTRSISINVHDVAFDEFGRGDLSGLKVNQRSNGHAYLSAFITYGDYTLTIFSPDFKVDPAA